MFVFPAWQLRGHDLFYETHQTKLTGVLVLCRHEFNNLIIPDGWMFVRSLYGVLTIGAALLQSLF
jgi:hypothetical protein